MILTIIAIGAFSATLIGGLVALKFNDKLHLILGFSAGALLGVAFFDLLPESLYLASSQYNASTVTSFVALGFIIFMIVDRFISPHHHGVEDCQNEGHSGRLGASGLSLHSFLDGLGIGLAFQVSISVGVIVTIAVLVHDFSDGINTVGLILKNGGGKREAIKWLFLDAIAPVLGIAVSVFISLPESILGIALAIFCGFFLYIGASDLLPESHHRHPTIWTTFMTVLGVFVLYIAIKFAGI